MKEKIYCIGIGGIGLSGLAQILNEQGNEVSGSDMENSEILEEMRKKNMEIFIGHDENYLKNDVNRVIYSSAIPDTNPELQKAIRLGKKMQTFPQAVKEFTENLYTIAICGTHGKTTTTAFVSLALLAGEKDPTVIIGSKLKEFGNKGYRVGNGDFFVVEACEYKRNFLNYSPNIIVLTNLEAEHLDYFKDLEDYKNAFKEFIAKLPADGFLIANIDDANVIDVIKDFHGNLITFASNNHSADFILDENKIIKNENEFGTIELQIPGDFNKMNALCGLIVGQITNVDKSLVLEQFKEFTGTWRRFEILGELAGMKVISDYAHHPTAITKTLAAAKDKYPDKKICCIFQPHQYNRTKKFLPEFGKAFLSADIVIIPNIYKVRDKKEDIEAVSEDLLIEAIEKAGTKTFKIKEYSEIKEFLIHHKNEIDIIFVMGAGDIWHLGEYLLS
ncbi:UDP-N-acetylmuramate--L-alanine ligase [Patescibacteria group bacterium]|nr:UDP-N-acetylmuramate--L-alanine ligase [Patescibacteria group bacterium]